MNTRLLCAPLITITFFAAGCSHHPASVTRQSSPQPQPLQTAGAQTPNNVGTPGEAVAPQGQPAIDASKTDVAAALAHQTEQYARNVQDSMSKYAARAAQPPAPGQETTAGWVDPAEFRIGPVDGGKQSTRQAIGQPTNPATSPIQAKADVKFADPQLPVANQTISTTEAKRVSEAANTPAVIPEASLEQTASSVITPNHPAGDALATKLATRAKDFPRDMSAQLDYQLMLFLQDQSVPELSSIASLPTEDRELISAVLDGVSNFRNALRADNNMLLSQKIHPLTELADRLRAQADLSIPTLTLCTRVDGYGRYEPIDPPRFIAGKEQQAIIYCELENFSSQIKDDKKQWQTDVTQEAVLYMEGGEQVWSDKTQQISDLSRNRRHDFFLRTLVKFPPTLTIGRYLLKVTIVDKQTNRVAEASLPIQVVAQ